MMAKTIGWYKQLAAGNDAQQLTAHQIEQYVATRP
jgi:hypothetical protein